MEFAAPAAFALAVLVLPVVWLARRRRSRGFAVASGTSLSGLSPGWRLRLARLLPVVRVLAVLALVVAVAGPRQGDANAVVPGEGIDIALSMDISSSMNASFGRGSTRLEETKKVIREFIKGRENDRIGFVVFQRDALALSPPSLDYEALDSIVDETDSGLLPDGTGIGVGLASALNMLQDSNAATRIVILLTDGEHNADSITPEEAAEVAVALKIKVYTIGVVSPGSVGRSTEIDEKLLQEIAERTGARYFAADNPQSLLDVYEEIGALETSKVGRERYEQFTELAPWFAGAGAALLGAELLLRGLWLRRAPL